MLLDPRARAADFAALAQDDAARRRARSSLSPAARLEDAIALAACLLADALRRSRATGAIDAPLPPPLRTLRR